MSRMFLITSLIWSSLIAGTFFCWFFFFFWIRGHLLPSVEANSLFDGCDFRKFSLYGVFFFLHGTLPFQSKCFSLGFCYTATEIRRSPPNSPWDMCIWDSGFSSLKYKACFTLVLRLWQTFSSEEAAMVASEKRWGCSMPNNWSQLALQFTSCWPKLSLAANLAVPLWKHI